MDFFPFKCLAQNLNLSFDKVQIPLWQLNLNVQTDAWKDLHKMTGTKDKVKSVYLYPFNPTRTNMFIGQETKKLHFSFYFINTKIQKNSNISVYFSRQ